MRLIDADALEKRVRDVIGILVMNEQAALDVIYLIQKAPTIETRRNEMTINDYQIEVMRTASGMNHEHHEMLENAALGLCGESGEVADLVKKAFFQGHKLDKVHLAKELGDVAWYLAVGAYALDYDLETVLQMNVDKLRERYPGGFEAERSLHREVGDV